LEVAPTLLLQVGLKGYLNLTVDLGGAANGPIHFAPGDGGALSVILKERLRSGVKDGSGTGLQDRDVREVSEDTSELLIKKACEQSGWMWCGTGARSPSTGDRARSRSP
jgi:hypothetical protein